MSHDSFSVCNAKIANQETQTKFFHKNSRFYYTQIFTWPIPTPSNRFYKTQAHHCRAPETLSYKPGHRQHARQHADCHCSAQAHTECHNPHRQGHCSMPELRIVFSRLHFYRQHTALHLYDKIQFTAFLVVVVVCVEPVRRQFLRHGILIDRAIIDVASPFNNAQLDAFSILCGEQPHITLK